MNSNRVDVAASPLPFLLLLVLLVASLLLACTCVAADQPTSALNGSNATDALNGSNATDALNNTASPSTDTVYPTHASSNDTKNSTSTDCDPPGPCNETDNDTGRPKLLRFAFVTSFGASFNTSGTVPAVDMALEKIAELGAVLPSGYALGYSPLGDSQVTYVRACANTSFLLFLLLLSCSHVLSCQCTCAYVSTRSVGVVWVCV